MAIDNCSFDIHLIPRAVGTCVVIWRRMRLSESNSGLCSSSAAMSKAATFGLTCQNRCRAVVVHRSPTSRPGTCIRGATHNGRRSSGSGSPSSSSPALPTLGPKVRWKDRRMAFCGPMSGPCFSDGESVLFCSLLTGSTLDPDLRIGGAAWMPDITLITGVATPLDNRATVGQEYLVAAIDNARAVIVGAWDDEGLIFWEPFRPA
jgi:hypothetical protein